MRDLSQTRRPKLEAVYILRPANKGVGGFLWTYRAALRRACVLLSILAFFLAVWLTLRTSGDIPELLFLPSGLVRWVNGHGLERNVPAYFLLGLPLFALTSTPLMRLGFAIAAVFAALLEFAQMAVPSRTFDVRDVALSWVGLLFAYLVIRRLKQQVLYRQVKVIRSHAVGHVHRTGTGLN